MRERDKKRHQGGSTSRTHHSKKLKEPVVVVDSGKDDFSLKIGVNSRVPITVERSVPGDISANAIRFCKEYVEKVILRFILFFRKLISYSLFCVYFTIPFSLSC